MKNSRALAIAAVAGLSSFACAARPREQIVAYVPQAAIEITSSPNSAVLIYASVPSQFTLRGEALRVRSDTIRAITPVRLEAYLNPARFTSRRMVRSH